MNEKDSSALTVTLKDKIKKSVETELMSETYLVKKEFLRTLGTKFSAKMEEKALEDLKKPNFVLAIRTEHAVVSMGAGASEGSKASSSKAAKGGKGAKGKTTAQETTDENMLEINFNDKAGLVKELKSSVKDLPEDLNEPMIEYFLK